MELRSERKMEKAASKAHHLPDPVFTGRRGRSAVNIPNLPDGAWIEIEEPGYPIAKKEAPRGASRSIDYRTQ
jgi:hypothetical protein